MYTQIDLKAHGENIEKLRKLNNFKQNQMADIIGTNRASYNNIINSHGQYKLNQVHAANLMRHFEVEYFWLYFNEGSYEESHEKYLLAERRENTEDSIKLCSLQEKCLNYQRVEKELNDKVDLQAELIAMLKEQIKRLETEK